MVSTHHSSCNSAYRIRQSPQAPDALTGLWHGAVYARFLPADKFRQSHPPAACWQPQGLTVSLACFTTTLTSPVFECSWSPPRTRRGTATHQTMWIDSTISRIVIDQPRACPASQTKTPYRKSFSPRKEGTQSISTYSEPCHSISLNVPRLPILDPFYQRIQVISS
jgi:hypothetical protein